MTVMARLRGLLQRRRAHHEIDDELAFHLDMETRANIARGMTPAEARQAALRAFGGVAQAKETVRDVRTLPVESLWHDVRLASRTLAAHRGFTIAAAGMLALAIGITTAMFTLVDTLILRPVPFRDPDQLAHLSMPGAGIVSPAVLKAWRELPVFESAESAVRGTALLEIGSTVATRGIATVTPGVFEMLGGVRPVRGRLFDDTDPPGRADRVLVSETVWRSLYAADPALVGGPITVNGERLTVVGILPADFRFPSPETALWRPRDLDGGGEQRLTAYVRLAAGVPPENALRFATAAARAADPRNRELVPQMHPLAGLRDAYSNRAIRLLAGGVVLVFLVLCANVCGLLLARLTTRRREFSTRAALGASRARLMQQALVENAALGVLGIVIGAAVAWALVSLARALVSEPLLMETLNPLQIDGRALVATSVAGLVATFAAGLLPACLGMRVDAGDTLRVADRGGTATRGARVLTRGLLIVEVALACTLLVGATLLTRSFVNLVSADRGLVTSGVTTLWLNLTFLDDDDAAARNALARTLEDELRQLPGVRQLAWSYGVPPEGGFQDTKDWIADLPGAAAMKVTLNHYVVSDEFFGLYGIPIVRGRTFGVTDAFTDVVVSERFAQAMWPGVDPVGRTVRSDGPNPYRVIGVARETHYPSMSPGMLDGPEVYHRYTPVGTPMLSLRCEPACPDTAVIRHRLAATHPAVGVQRATVADDRYAREFVRPRATAALAVVFAVVALAAAAAGLFSVLSYAVNRRRREFGIRTALGASPVAIRGVVLRDGLVIGASGVAVGSVFAAILARALASLQYGVTPGDPLSWSIVLGVVALATVAASWGPAGEAARADPVALLRAD